MFLKVSLKKETVRENSINYDEKIRKAEKWLIVTFKNWLLLQGTIVKKGPAPICFVPPLAKMTLFENICSKNIRSRSFVRNFCPKSYGSKSFVLKYLFQKIIYIFKYASIFEMDTFSSLTMLLTIVMLCDTILQKHWKCLR
jgi:hypothetical protein